MNRLLIFILILCYISSAAQHEVKGNKTKFKSYALYTAMGWSQVNSSPSAPTDFPSFEFRLGPSVSIPVSSKFEISSRFLFGAKLKREAYNVDGQAYVITPPYLELDEVASSRNHYFFEIPLILQFNLQSPELSFYAGGNYRFWMPNNSDVDFLTNRGDFGVLMGISYPIADKWRVGAEYLFGITKVYSYNGTIDGTEVSATASNNTFQFFIQYRFKKTNLKE